MEGELIEVGKKKVPTDKNKTKHPIDWFIFNHDMWTTVNLLNMLKNIHPKYI